MRHSKATTGNVNIPVATPATVTSANNPRKGFKNSAEKRMNSTSRSGFPNNPFANTTTVSIPTAQEME